MYTECHVDILVADEVEQIAQFLLAVRTAALMMQQCAGKDAAYKCHGRYKRYPDISFCESVH